MLTGGSMRTSNPLTGGAARTDVNERKR